MYAERPWALELDAEVAPAAPGLISSRAAALALLLARVPGVDGVSARPHCAGRFVVVAMTVAAPDLSDAVDQACTSLHRCAADAGLAPLVVVAARSCR